MKITRVLLPPPPPPPAEYRMTFSRDDGWAIAMCLMDAYKKYPMARGREEWKEWANMLDKELRK